VVVDWIDSVGQGHWGEYDEKTDMRCTSVGFLLKKDKTRIVLAMNKSHQGATPGYGHYMTIPALAVKKIRKLR